MSSTTTEPRLKALPARLLAKARAPRPIGEFDLRRELPYIAAAVLAAVLLTGWNLVGGPRYFEDEGTYTVQAWSVLEFTLSPYWYSFDHPPLAWMQMSPLAWTFSAVGLGDTAVDAARYVSLLTVAYCAGAVYVIGRRLLLGRLFALGAVTVFLLSPLTQDLMRRVYIDNIALCWALTAFIAVLHTGRHRWNYWLAGMALGVATLSKETMLLLAPALAVAVFTYARREERWSAVGTTAFGALIVGLAYPFWAVTTDRGGALWSALKWQLFERSGSWLEEGSFRHTIVERWLSLDSTLLWGGIGAAALLLLVPRKRWIGVAALVPLVQVVRSDGYLPSMLVIMILPFLALAVMGVAQLAWGLAARLLPSDQARANATRVLAAFMVLGSLGIVGGRLASPLYTEDANISARQGAEWVLDNTASVDRVMVDDVAFAELRRHGRTDPWHQAVYVYKVDYDPVSSRELPGGWEDIDYVLETPLMRGALADSNLAQANLALRNSTPVATFGEGFLSTIVRKVNQ